MSAEVRPFPRPEEGSLTALFANLERAVAETTPEVIPALLAQLAALQTALAARLAAQGHRNSQETPAELDRLLTVEQAARRLKVSEDWLYRHAAKLPFTVRLGPRQLRFSVRGIGRYSRQRQGR